MGIRWGDSVGEVLVYEGGWLVWGFWIINVIDM